MQPETQESLSARFAVQQEIQLTLIEKESTNLKDHLKYWEAVRKENVIAFYARKENILRLGLQPLPTTTITEYKAKEAIKIMLLIESLLKSEYGIETWTLSEVSAETLNNNPKNCFKKKPFIVTVWFDNDAQNSFPYTCWECIYYQDDNSKWHKTSGLVDHNGLYFIDYRGDYNYFQLFQPDAIKYGHTGQWTVKYKNQTVLASVTSSTRTPYSYSETRPGPSTGYCSEQESPRRRQTNKDTNTESPSSSTSPAVRLRRRRGSGEQDTTDSTRRGTKRKLGANSAPTPGEVGTRSHTVAKHGLTRLERLQREAWDPPIILLTGQQNNLKCWRNRCKRYSDLFLCSSSVWKWLGPTVTDHASKLLVAFANDEQRQLFLNTVTIPKGTTVALGSLNAL